MPAALHVYGVYSREREVGVRNPRTGERERKVRKRYDARFRVDAYEFRYGLDQKGWADDFAQRLKQDFAQGLLFDPESRRFLPAALPAVDQRPTTSFVDHATDYLQRQWHRWEPATRRNAQRDLSTACIYLSSDQAPVLAPGDRVAADEYLRRMVLAVPATAPATREDRGWAEWFEKWSLPLREVNDAHLRLFVDRIRVEALDGTSRRLADSSLARTRAVVRAAFTNARKRRLIEWDPWDGVEAEPLRDHDKVDPDLVMDPDEVRRIAAACGAVDQRYEAFVLVQGLCGLRPGEAMELRRRDLQLVGDVPAVTARGTHPTVPERFFVPGEDRRRPLKGRGFKATRTVPIPSELVPLLRRHLDRHVEPAAGAVVFTNTAGGRLSANFHRGVWSKARVAVFDADSPLRGVRLHDLRHSAITTWLNAGVALKTAQAWSGHKTLSVLLDTYLGVMKGDEAAARERWESALATGSVTGT